MMLTIKRVILVCAMAGTSVLTGYTVVSGNDVSALACTPGASCQVTQESCDPRDCPPCCQLTCDPSQCDLK